MIPEHLERWTIPKSYAGARWDGWYVFLSQNRESDELTQSNFDTAWARLSKLPALAVEFDDGVEGMNGIQKVRENHWAVGWVEWIAVHESNEAALQMADELAEKIDSYPVLDEQDWGRREEESAQVVWKDCYNTKERLAYIRKHRSQFELRDLADFLGCVHGHYFSGYASELLH